MPVFTMLLGFLSMPFAAILDKLIITGIAIGVGLIVDVTLWVVITIKDKDKPDNGFAIDWGA